MISGFTGVRRHGMSSRSATSAAVTVYVVLAHRPVDELALGLGQVAGVIGCISKFSHLHPYCQDIERSRL